MPFNNSLLDFIQLFFSEVSNFWEGDPLISFYPILFYFNTFALQKIDTYSFISTVITDLNRITKTNFNVNWIMFIIINYTIQYLPTIVHFLFLILKQIKNKRGDWSSFQDTTEFIQAWIWSPIIGFSSWSLLILLWFRYPINFQNFIAGFDVSVIYITILYFSIVLAVICTLVPPLLVIWLPLFLWLYYIVIYKKKEKNMEKFTINLIIIGTVLSCIILFYSVKPYFYEFFLFRFVLLSWAESWLADMPLNLIVLTNNVTKHSEYFDPLFFPDPLKSQIRFLSYQKTQETASVIIGIASTIVTALLSKFLYVYGGIKIMNEILDFFEFPKRIKNLLNTSQEPGLCPKKAP